MSAARVLLVILGLAATCPAQEWLDRVEDALRLQTKDGLFRAALSGLVDVEGYYVDQRPPGLLFGEQSFVNARASFFVDTKLGEHFYGFLQARVDRGFDPLSKDFDARLDEYLLRWTPLPENKLNLQFGKFATVVGSWVQRHDSWQNPLITAPLAYENITIASDSYPPASPSDFLARRSYPDQKDDWLPMIWGPVYAAGGSIFGSLGQFDYAFEIKNAALASRPDTWGPVENPWTYPTVGGRLGFRPNEAWNHGVSFSVGPYLYELQTPLPPGRSIGDYDQILLGYDVSYARGRWQFWAEVFLNRFQVPNVGNADALSYYIEAKYKITSALYAAARWNQEISGTVPDGVGGYQTWDRDMVRIDVALGCRFSRHFQGKLQYSFGHRDAPLQQGEQLVAAQLTLRY